MSFLRPTPLTPFLSACRNAVLVTAVLLAGACADGPTAPTVFPRRAASATTSSAGTPERADSARSGGAPQSGQTPIWW